MAFSHMGLVNTVISLRSAGYSWGDIRKKIAPDVPKIVFYKIANTSYEPKDPILRHKLKLPQLKEVTLCEKCGKIKSKYHECEPSTRPPRIAIRLDNPMSAAKSIQGRMEPKLIKELVRLLDD
jgi:hypothetical protein